MPTTETTKIFARNFRKSSKTNKQTNTQNKHCFTAIIDDLRRGFGGWRGSSTSLLVVEIRERFGVVVHGVAAVAIVLRATACHNGNDDNNQTTTQN
jgi:hypothetical protein